MVTGFDDRRCVGYVVYTGADMAPADPGACAVTAGGTTVLMTPELAASLRDALTHRPTALLAWSGPEVPLTLDDVTLLAWLRHDVGGVLTVTGEPGPDPRLAG
ncbi:MAG TPA: hypothetical protein VM367_07875 [Pseudonocardia sp.]|nr:hypothetical protein [Pseudonocardia sp.]